MKLVSNVPTAAFTLNTRATWDVIVDDKDKAVAIFSSKIKLSHLAMIVPDMVELITALSEAYDDNQSSHELASRLYDLRCRALRLMAKIEGGEE